MQAPNWDCLFNLLHGIHHLAAFQLDNYIDDPGLADDEIGDFLVWLKETVSAASASFSAALVSMDKQDAVSAGVVESGALSVFRWS